MPRTFFALLALVFLLTGCGGRPKSVSQIVKGVEVDMWESSDCVQAGDTVKLRATLTNRSTTAFMVDAKDQPAFDILTGAGRGQIRWSDSRSLTAELTHLELKPGESKSLEMDLQIPKNQPAGFIGSQAHFISNPDSPDDPLIPWLTFNVGACYGIGP